MIGWTGDDATRTLDLELVRALGEWSGVQTWPVVLDIDGLLSTDRPESLVASSPAGVDAGMDLERAGLLDRGEPSSWAEWVSAVLSQPDRELEIRMFSKAGVRRICLARKGERHVLAERGPTSIRVGLPDIPDMTALAQAVWKLFPSQPASDLGAISGPSAEFTDRLGRCRDPADMIDAFYAMGAAPGDAAVAAAALARCRSRTEIVAVAHREGSIAQSCGAVAVFDTERGRIMSSVSKAPDGRMWTTLSSGSGHRIGQAVGLLVETLPGGTWFA